MGRDEAMHRSLHGRRWWLERRCLKRTTRVFQPWCGEFVSHSGFGNLNVAQVIIMGNMDSWSREYEPRPLDWPDPLR